MQSFMSLKLFNHSGSLQPYSLFCLRCNFTVHLINIYFKCCKTLPQRHLNKQIHSIKFLIAATAYEFWLLDCTLHKKKKELLHHNCGNTLVNEDVCTQNIIFCCLLPQTKDIEATLNHEFLKKQKKKIVSLCWLC